MTLTREHRPVHMCTAGFWKARSGLSLCSPNFFVSIYLASKGACWQLLGNYSAFWWARCVPIMCSPNFFLSGRPDPYRFCAHETFFILCSRVKAKKCSFFLHFCILLKNFLTWSHTSFLYVVVNAIKSSDFNTNTEVYAGGTWTIVDNIPITTGSNIFRIAVLWLHLIIIGRAGFYGLKVAK